MASEYVWFLNTAPEPIHYSTVHHTATPLLHCALLGSGVVGSRAAPTLEGFCYDPISAVIGAPPLIAVMVSDGVGFLWIGRQTT